jgi:hypothetical protein
MIASLIDARKRFVRLIVAARQSGVMLWVVANAAGLPGPFRFSTACLRR